MDIKAAAFYIPSIAKRAKKYEKEWTGNYHMEVRLYDREKGIVYGVR